MQGKAEEVAMCMSLDWWRGGTYAEARHRIVELGTRLAQHIRVQNALHVLTGILTWTASATRVSKLFNALRLYFDLT